MLPDRVSNPGPQTYESGALPTARARAHARERERERERNYFHCKRRSVTGAGPRSTINRAPDS